MFVVLLIFLVLAFFFVFKFTAAITAIVAIVMGTTTITTLVCVWLGTSYYLRASGYDPNSAEQTYRQVNSELKELVSGLQELRFELEEVEPYLRDAEFLRYARQHREPEN